MDFVQLVDLVSRGGLLVALLAAIWGGKQGWYLWRDSHEQIVRQIVANGEIVKHDLDEMQNDRDFWRGQAMQALNAANKAVGIVKQSSETER